MIRNGIQWDIRSMGYQITNIPLVMEGFDITYTYMEHPWFCKRNIFKVGKHATRILMFRFLQGPVRCTLWMCNIAMETMAHRNRRLMKIDHDLPTTSMVSS